MSSSDYDASLVPKDVSTPQLKPIAEEEQEEEETYTDKVSELLSEIPTPKDAESELKERTAVVLSPKPPAVTVALEETSPRATRSRGQRPTLTIEVPKNTQSPMKADKVGSAVLTQLKRVSSSKELSDLMRLKTTTREIVSSIERRVSSKSAGILSPSPLTSPRTHLPAYELERFGKKTQNVVTKLAAATYLPRSVVQARLEKPASDVEMKSPKVADDLIKNAKAQKELLSKSKHDEVESALRQITAFEEGYLKLDPKNPFFYSNLFSMADKLKYELDNLIQQYRNSEKYENDGEKILNLQALREVLKGVKQLTSLLEEEKKAHSPLHDKINTCSIVYKKDEVIQSLRLYLERAESDSDRDAIQGVLDTVSHTHGSYVAKSVLDKLPVAVQIVSPKITQTTEASSKTIDLRSRLFGQLTEYLSSTEMLSVADHSEKTEVMTLIAGVMKESTQCIPLQKIKNLKISNPKRMEILKEEIQMQRRTIKDHLEESPFSSQFISILDNLEKAISDPNKALLDAKRELLALHAKLQKDPSKLISEAFAFQSLKSFLIGQSEWPIQYDKKEILIELNKLAARASQSDLEVIRSTIQLIQNNEHLFISQEDLVNTFDLTPISKGISWAKYFPSQSTDMLGVDLFFRTLTDYVSIDDLPKTSERVHALIAQSQAEQVFSSDFAFKIGRESVRELLASALLSSIGLNRFVVPKLEITLAGFALEGETDPLGVASRWIDAAPFPIKKWNAYSEAVLNLENNIGKIEVLKEKLDQANQRKIESEIEQKKFSAAKESDEGYSQLLVANAALVIHEKEIRNLEEKIKVLQQEQVNLKNKVNECATDLNDRETESSRESLMELGVIDLLLCSSDSHSGQLMQDKTTHQYQSIDFARFLFPSTTYKNAAGEVFANLRTHSLNHPFAFQKLPESLIKFIKGLEPKEIRDKWADKIGKEDSFNKPFSKEIYREGVAEWQKIQNEVAHVKSIEDLKSICEHRNLGQPFDPKDPLEVAKAKVFAEIHKVLEKNQMQFVVTQERYFEKIDPKAFEQVMTRLEALKVYIEETEKMPGTDIPNLREAALRMYPEFAPFVKAIERIEGEPFEHLTAKRIGGAAAYRSLNDIVRVAKDNPNLVKKSDVEQMESIIVKLKESSMSQGDLQKVITF